MLAAAPSVVDVRAESRVEGNDRPDALAIARALLRTVWPAQVAHVRVDAIGSHRVAGVIVSGVKFHRRLDVAGFDAEIAALVERSFAAGPVEEVDVWATVPLDAGVGTVVSGDLAKPTSRVVFSMTIPRNRRSSVRAQLASGRDVYWDATFRRDLQRKNR